MKGAPSAPAKRSKSEEDQLDIETPDSPPGSEFISDAFNSELDEDDLMKGMEQLGMDKKGQYLCLLFLILYYFIMLVPYINWNQFFLFFLNAVDFVANDWMISHSIEYHSSNVTRKDFLFKYPLTTR